MQPLVSPPPHLSFTLVFSLFARQLAEALLSLANLTSDEDAREALYARAQVEGGEAVRRELGPPSPTSSRQTITADIQMDES